MSWYEKVIVPLFFLLFFIKTLKPVLSEIISSKFFILGSFDDFKKLDFFLKIFTKLSVCLTDNFFSIILLAIKDAFSRPTKILAWPAVIFFSSIYSKTSLGKFNNLRELVI